MDGSGDFGWSEGLWNVATNVGESLGDSVTVTVNPEARSASSNSLTHCSKGLIDALDSVGEGFEVRLICGADMMRFLLFVVES